MSNSPSIDDMMIMMMTNEISSQHSCSIVHMCLCVRQPTIWVPTDDRVQAQKMAKTGNFGFRK